MVFKTLEDGIEFYRQYAGACGFDSRIGSQTKECRPRTNTVVWKYVVCNRVGFKNPAKSKLVEASHGPVFSAVSNEQPERSHNDAEAHILPEQAEPSQMCLPNCTPVLLKVLPII
ncbi:unnamed protein product [Cuscuta epithymum]|nr:unnamed protein product [Cuscuta epithymum]